MIPSVRFRGEFCSKRTWIRVPLAGLILAAAAIRAAPPGIPFADLVEAYTVGQPTEARELARKYLASSEAAVRSAKSDSERLQAAKLLLRAASLTVSNESFYPQPGRFRNAADLLGQVARAVTAAESAAVPPESREELRSEIADVCRYWLVATIGVRSPTQREKFLRDHADVLRAADIRSLDEPIFQALAHKPALGAGGGQQFATIAQGFVEAYSARNPAAISALTQIGEAEVARRLASGRMQFFAASADHVLKIGLGTVGTDYISLNRGQQKRFLFYLPDVTMQLAMTEGGTYSKTVDRVLYVDEDPGGRLRITIPVETPIEPDIQQNTQQ